MRLRIPQLKSNETAVKIFDEVRNVAGIETADINETTGSLLIRFVPELLTSSSLKRSCSTTWKGSLSAVGVRRENSEKQGASQGGERQMMLFGGATLASILLKNWKLHTYAGIAYTVFTLLHMCRYRKTLTR